jgi:hypothetical protein
MCIASFRPRDDDVPYPVIKPVPALTTPGMTIAERVAHMHEEAATQIPAEIFDVFRAEQARMGADGVPQGAATVGDVIPDVELLDAHGAPTTLRAAQAGGAAVVVLYRGDWCPYCNLALRAYQEDLVPVLDDRGIGLIAISPQKPDKSLSMQEKNDLSFVAVGPRQSDRHGARGAHRTLRTGAKRAACGRYRRRRGQPGRHPHRAHSHRRGDRSCGHDQVDRHPPRLRDTHGSRRHPRGA